MRWCRLLGAGVFSCALICPVVSLAQKPPREFLVVYEDHVKPSGADQYEAQTKAFMKALSDANLNSPTFEIAGFMYDDFTYVYLTPLKDFSALDAMDRDWATADQKVGKEKMQAIMAATSPTLNGYSEMIAEHLPALSYRPSAPRLKDSEMPYFVDYYYYVTPGKEDEFKGLAKQFADLYRSKGITDGWEFYQCLMGEDLPFFVVAQGARDAADFAASDQKDTAALGDEGKALFGKVMAICRKIEARPGKARPDLSHHAPPPEASKK